MVTKELLKRIRKIEIVTTRLVNEQIAGQYHSVFKGRGMSFSEVREYQPGDDIRVIDWNVSARMNSAYVKQFVEERELTVMLLVDASASQRFGTREQSKAELLAELVALFGFSAMKNGDRVGLIIFTDRVEKVVPPKKGSKHILRTISEVLNHRPASPRTDLNAGLSYLSKVSKRKSVAFLISDFQATGYEKAFRIAHEKHDVIPVILADQLEEELPDVGLLTVEDAETGELVQVDTSDAGVRADYAREVKRARETRDQLFRKLKCDTLDLRTGAPFMQAIIGFFLRRARRW
jgi:uncharacterized protein (DUF58 family)